MSARMWRNLNLCTLFMGMCNDEAAMKNSLGVPERAKNRITL